MKRLLLSFLASICVILLCALPIHSQAADSNGPDWANPQYKTLRTVTTAHTPDRYRTSATENLECQDMLGGCFTQMAFGLQDVESNRAVFAGTGDTALSLTPFISGQVLIGWPGTDTVLALTNISTGGVQIGLYRSFTATLVDRYNLAGQIIGKTVSRNADFILSDGIGKKFVFNTNSLAFSDNASWFVAETLHAGFIRINLATLGVVTIAPAYSSPSSSQALKASQLAVSDSGQFVAITNRAVGELRVYDLARCSNQICASHDYYPFLKTQLPSGFSAIHMRFLNDNLLSFRTLNGLLEASYLLAPSEQIRSLFSYLGLGDSYAAGQGVERYRNGTDTPTNHCHLSESSYPILVRDALFSRATGNSVACSGAKIHDIETDNPPLVEPDMSAIALQSFLPGILPQSAFVSQYQPEIITTEIGGNDIGFGSIIVECVIPKARDTTCYDTYEDRLELAKLIDRTTPRLTRLYKKLQARAPLAKLYVLGYPQVATNGNCAANVQLNAAEIQFANLLVNQLNAAIAEASKQSGAHYIDISLAFVGHRFCETESSRVAMNGITYGKDAGFSLPKSLGGGKVRTLSGGSYHPNALGQELISKVVIAHLRGTAHSTPPVYKSAASDLLGFLNSPKNNRDTVALQFVNFTKSNNPPGESFAVNLRGIEFGIKPNTDYAIHLDGQEGPILETLRTDSSANLIGLVPLPKIYSGGHTVDIIGPNQVGELTDIRQVITTEDTLADQVQAEGTTSEQSPHEDEATPAAMVSETPPTQQGTQDTDTLASISVPQSEKQPAKQVLGTSTQSSQSGTPQSAAIFAIDDTTPRQWPALQKTPWVKYLYYAGGLWIVYICLTILSSRRMARP